MLGKTPWNDEQARSLIDARRGEPGAMLPILHDLQERFGYIDSAAIPLSPRRSTSPRPKRSALSASIMIFDREPVDGAVLKLCRAESCQALGCEDLVAHLADAHGLEVDGHAHGPLSVETVYCLGHCALSPTALLDGEPIGRLDRARLDEIVAGAKRRPQ